MSGAMRTDERVEDLLSSLPGMSRDLGIIMAHTRLIIQGFPEVEERAKELDGLANDQIILKKEVPGMIGDRLREVL